MKRLLATLLMVMALVVAFAAPAMAQPPHSELQGCKAVANGETYLVDVGVLYGLPPGALVEPFGPCCVRGYYEGTIPMVQNGFPGGCCRGPGQTPGPPPPAEDRDFPIRHYVGNQCQCPATRF